MTELPRSGDPFRSDLLATPPRAARPPRAYPTLRDAWPWARPFTLDGGLERQGFTPGWTALLVAVGAFLAYQLAGSVAAAVAIVGRFAGGPTPPDMQEVLEAISSDAVLLLGSNALGQLVGFGLVVWAVTRLSTRQGAAFLRLRRPDLAALGLAVLGWVVLYPGLTWLGALNQFLPQPHWLEQLEDAQNDMIEQALTQAGIGAPFLVLTMALTPALFEELLFRGYLQRQVERSRGAAWSIVAVGVGFGLYHLRLTQVVPLALLGCYLGYVVWASGSLYTAMLVHLLNNGLAVLVAVYARSSPDLDLDAVENATVPWTLGVLSLLAAAGVLALLRRRREAVAGRAPDAAPVPPPTPPEAPSAPPPAPPPPDA